MSEILSQRNYSNDNIGVFAEAVVRDANGTKKEIGSGWISRIYQLGYTSRNCLTRDRDGL